MPLQLPELAAHRRLGHPTGFGSAAEVSIFGKGNKITEFLQVHVMLLMIGNGYRRSQYNRLYK
jgi:hypothetical protein